jgi:hypothetical protein
VDVSGGVDAWRRVSEGLRVGAGSEAAAPPRERLAGSAGSARSGSHAGELEVSTFRYPLYSLIPGSTARSMVMPGGDGRTSRAVVEGDAAHEGVVLFDLAELEVIAVLADAARGAGDFDGLAAKSRLGVAVAEGAEALRAVTSGSVRSRSSARQSRFLRGAFLGHEFLACSQKRGGSLRSLDARPSGPRPSRGRRRLRGDRAGVQGAGEVEAGDGSARCPGRGRCSARP